MKKTSLSMLFIGALGLCASDQPARVDYDLLKVLVAACNVGQPLRECEQATCAAAEQKMEWTSIQRPEHVREFAGKIVEYQISSRIKCEENDVAYSAPGFPESFFGFVFPQGTVCTFSQPRRYDSSASEFAYELFLFVKPEKSWFQKRRFGSEFLAMCEQRVQMRQMTDEAQQVLLAERKAQRWEVPKVWGYTSELRELLGIEAQHPWQKKNKKTHWKKLDL